MISVSNTICDAHLHIPRTNVCGGAISTLLSDMDKAAIEKAVLIVNKECEMQAVKNDIDVFLANQHRFHIVSGVNVKSSNPLSIYNYFDELSETGTDIKLHPTMFGYTMADLQNIINTLSALKFRVITIDSLCFGEQLENHIGIELAIRLAQTFPEKKIVVAHSGFIKLLECQMYTRNLPNIFYDLSFTASYINHTSVRQDMVNFLKYTSGRIMFGSDYPDFSFERAINSLLDLCSEAKLSDEVLKNVLFNNALSVYWDKYNNTEIIK